MSISKSVKSGRRLTLNCPSHQSTIKHHPISIIPKDFTIKTIKKNHLIVFIKLRQLVISPPREPLITIMKELSLLVDVVKICPLNTRFKNMINMKKWTPTTILPSFHGLLLNTRKLAVTWKKIQLKSVKIATLLILPSGRSWEEPKDFS